MPKKKRPRKPAKPPSGPPKAIKEFARSYVCSHCRSNVDGIVKDPSGIWRMMVGHNDSCPVLRGTITDMHDAIRAALAAGQVAGVIAPFGGGAE
jgi:hypothetical protein